MSMDKRLRHKYWNQWKKCSKEHLNSPNARECWKCGEKFPAEPVRMTKYV